MADKRGIVFATDRRLSCAAEFLRKKGFAVDAVCTAGDWRELSGSFSGPLPAENAPDFVLLPIRGTIDGTVALAERAADSGETAGKNAGNADLRPLLSALKPEAYVFSAVSTPYEEALPCRFVCYQRDPEFASGNAKLAAEGILWLLLTKTPRSIFSYTYDILGAGRVGRNAAKLLTDLGLRVRLVDITGAPDTVSPEEWKNSAPARVVINTAPKALIDGAVIDRWRSSGSASERDPVYIIDVATGQVGVEEKEKGAAGTVYLPAPPLPGFVAPETAGTLIAEAMLRAMDRGTAGKEQEK